MKKYLGKIVKVKMDRPLNSLHPKHGFKYELNYGFIPDTVSGDGEELDAYVIGIEKPIKEFIGKCVAIIHRLNDNDDKLVVIPEEVENITDEEIITKTMFQEKFFKSEIIRG
jgi:inorganic pyrophosphatase